MAEWLRRDVHTLALCYRLCLTEKDFRAELKHLKITEPVAFQKTSRSNATTHFMQNRGNNAWVAIVCMPTAAERTLEQCHALLVHEAMHVWQEHCRLIGETHPSSEFEAYAVQLISQELMLAYRRAAKRPCKRKRHG